MTTEGIEPERVKEQGERLMAEIRKVIVGQDDIVQNLLISLFARGQLRPVIDRCYPLAEVHAAYDRLDAGEQFGKVVVQVTR